MPGKVVRVMVKAGDEVQEGQGLVGGGSDEDGKRAEEPKAGKVTEAACGGGAAVESGAKLVVVV